jgi:hypothetical protein
MHGRKSGKAGVLGWKNSGQICSFSDGERHIGHIVKIEGQWTAFDAMHSNEQGNGFRSLGTFPDPDSAREAVEQCYRLQPQSLAVFA